MHLKCTVGKSNDNKKKHLVNDKYVFTEVNNFFLAELIFQAEEGHFSKSNSTQT